MRPAPSSLRSSDGAQGLRRLVVLTSLLVLAAGCGSDKDDAGGGSDAGRVEAVLRTQLAKGEVSGRVVDLGIDPPKAITCTEDPEREDGWRCSVTTGKGRTMVCIVRAQSQRRQPPAPVCGPIDY